MNLSFLPLQNTNCIQALYAEQMEFWNSILSIISIITLMKKMRSRSHVINTALKRKEKQIDACMRPFIAATAMNQNHHHCYIE
jgi:hypothetical protein